MSWTFYVKSTVFLSFVLLVVAIKADEPHQLDEFRAAAEHFRVKADCLEEEVDPLIGIKGLRRRPQDDVCAGRTAAGML